MLLAVDLDDEVVRVGLLEDDAIEVERDDHDLLVARRKEGRTADGELPADAVHLPVVRWRTGRHVADATRPPSESSRRTSKRCMVFVAVYGTWMMSPSPMRAWRTGSWGVVMTFQPAPCA